MQLSDDQQSQISNQSTDDLQNSGIKAKFVINTELHPKLQNEGDNRLWDYEDILNILGFGKTQWILLLVSGLLTMTSMSAVLSVGIIGISSQCEFDITQKERGVMMAACVTGIVLSTYIWGCMSDVWGRRKVLIWSMFLTNFLQFMSMFVTNIWFYNLINLLMGISLGGILGPIYPYLSEFNPAKFRAAAMNYSIMFVSITVMYVPAISWLVLSSDWSIHVTDNFTFRPWRLIILFGLLPGLIGALVLLPFPESPKLLLAHDRQLEAIKALDWISKFNTGKNLQTKLDCFTIHIKCEELVDSDLLKLDLGFSVVANIWKSTVPMFYKPHGTNVTLAVVALLGLLFSSSGMQVWFPEIVNRLAVETGKETGATMCEILTDSYQQHKLNVTLKQETIKKFCDNTISSETYINNIILGFVTLLGFNLQGPLLHYFRRKTVLLGGLALGILFGILIHLVTNTTGILILLCLYILVPVLSVSNMCGAIVDLVPTHLRGKAVSLGFTLGRIGTVMATNLIAAMLATYCTGVFAIITCVVIVCAGIIYYLPI